MARWWYQADGETHGPLSTDELLSLLKRGTLAPSTPVKREGMPTWRPADAIDALAAARVPAAPPTGSSAPPAFRGQRAVAPVIPEETAGVNTAADVWPFQPPRDPTLAGPLRRYFARMLDYMGLVLLIETAVVIALVAMGLRASLALPGAAVLLTVLVSPAAMLVDAMIYGVFGATLGKALLGVKVLTNDGKKLTLTEYLIRNLWVWFAGFALSISYFAVATLGWQFARVATGKPAIYDQVLGYRAEKSPASILGIATYLATASVLLGLLVVFLGPGNRLAEYFDAVDPVLREYQWKNPRTGLHARIAGRWRPQVIEDRDSEFVVVFTDYQHGRGEVVFAAEDLGGLSFRRFVPRLKRATESTMTFRGAFSTDGTRWSGAGSLTSGVPIDVEIRHVSHRAWRIISIYNTPPERTPDDGLNDLRRSLESTLPDIPR